MRQATGFEQRDKTQETSDNHLLAHVSDSLRNTLVFSKFEVHKMAMLRDFFESKLSSDEEVELGTLLAATAIIFSKHKRRTEWTKDWLRERETFGAYSTLLREVLLEDDQEARRFLRMFAGTTDTVNREEGYLDEKSYSCRQKAHYHIALSWVR